MASVLIVEDEGHIASGLRFNLELEGHTVTLVSDGLEAKDLLERPETRFDLIVLDLMLPRVSGLELCRLRRKAGDYTPILMLTAKREESDTVLGLRLGADDYVSKPFNLEELLARIEALLRRRHWHAPPAQDPIWRFGEVEVAFTAALARVRGAEVKLTGTELAILRLFREQEGKVVSREALLEAAWGCQAPITTRTVDNFILRLRKALELEPSKPRHILSVRGLGYKFVEAPP